MLQKLVVHSGAIAHHQELRCCSLAEVPMTLLKVVKEYYYIFNCCPKVLRSLPQDRTVRNLRARQYDHEAWSALSGWSPGYAVPVPGTWWLQWLCTSVGILVNCWKYDVPSVRAVKSCCFHCGCTLRDSKFFWYSSYQQDCQYCRDQAASNIEMTERSSLKRRAREVGWCCVVVAAVRMMIQMWRVCSM